MNSFSDILSFFSLSAEPVKICSHGNGNINRTYLIDCADGSRYILQRISEQLTRRPDLLMENIVRVTEHLRLKEKDPRKVLTVVRGKAGENLYTDPSGSWRVYRYIEDSVCYSALRSDEDFYRTAQTFGRFEQELEDFDAELLYDTIPGFHDTPGRYRQLYQALQDDAVGRKKTVEAETEFLLKREEEMGILQHLRDEKELPTRVTHNDTKLNNILFDSHTGEPLCVIDLDTVMPGLSLYDFGDAIRYGAATADENDPDPSRMHLNLGRYQLFARGFLEACPGLTPLEKELLPVGARVITCEQAVRFLTDYLNGDIYYRIQRPEQNLERTRTQIRLLEDMEQNKEKMLTKS